MAVQAVTIPKSQSRGDADVVVISGKKANEEFYKNLKNVIKIITYYPKHPHMLKKMIGLRTGRLKELATPKTYYLEDQKEEITFISLASLNAIPSQRVIFLSQPRIRFATPEPLLPHPIKPSALKAKPSDRIMQLCKPKHTLQDERKQLPLQISRAALKAVVSERIAQLALPKVIDTKKVKTEPLTTKEKLLCLKGSRIMYTIASEPHPERIFIPSSRLEELAIPRLYKVLNRKDIISVSEKALNYEATPRILEISQARPVEKPPWF